MTLAGAQAHAATCCDRTMTPPFGLAGGAAGMPARLTMELPDGTARTLNGKGGFIAPHGARVVVDAPGSGGYGPASQRDPALVQADVLDGYVSVEAARRDYGFDPAAA